MLLSWTLQGQGLYSVMRFPESDFSIEFDGLLCACASTYSLSGRRRSGVCGPNCSVECEIETQEHLSALQSKRQLAGESDHLRGFAEAVREEAEADGGRPRLQEGVVKGETCWQQWPGVRWWPGTQVDWWTCPPPS